MSLIHTPPRPRSTLLPYTTLFRSRVGVEQQRPARRGLGMYFVPPAVRGRGRHGSWDEIRTEEHTSEVQAHIELLCRPLLEKKKRADKWAARRSREFELNVRNVATN